MNSDIQEIVRGDLSSKVGFSASLWLSNLSNLCLLHRVKKASLAHQALRYLQSNPNQPSPAWVVEVRHASSTAGTVFWSFPYSHLKSVGFADGADIMGIRPIDKSRQVLEY